MVAKASNATPRHPPTWSLRISGCRSTKDWRSFGPCGMHLLPPRSLPCREVVGRTTWTGYWLPRNLAPSGSCTNHFGRETCSGRSTMSCRMKRGPVRRRPAPGTREMVSAPPPFSRELMVSIHACEDYTRLAMDKYDIIVFLYVTVSRDGMGSRGELA